MTVAGGPKIETDGLVLYYDVNNIDSYPGEPTTNIVANPTPTTSWNVSNYLTSQVTLGYSYEDGIPQIELSNLTTESGYPRLVDSAFTSTLTGVYSISSEAKGTINDNFLFRIYEGGSTKITKSATLTSTGEWEKFTVSSTTAFILTTPYINPVIIAGTLYIRNIQVEAKTHVTPFVNGTRSSTDGLKDLSGQDNHADLTNATYDSNALIDYDGVSGYSTISDSSTLDIQGAMSIGAWIKLDTLTTTPSDPAIYARYDGTTAGTRQFWFSYRNAGSDKGIALYVVDSSNVLRGAYRTDWSPSIDTWYYIMGVFSPSNYMRIYINSVLDYEITTSIPADVHSTSIDSYIGAAPNYSTGYHFDGKIDLVQQYNQALTSQEILNNYNAQKSRFGH